MEATSDLITSLEEIYEALYYSLGIAELGIAGAVLLWGLIASVVGAIVSLVVSAVTAVVIWFVEALPTYKLAKKVDYKLAWLAWIPIFGKYFRMYVLANMVEQPFDLFNGKIHLESRSLSFWAYVAADCFGAALITAIVSILTAIPGIGPIVGSVSTLLYLIPPAVSALIEYAYLKDVLDLFRPDPKVNNTTSIVITLLDALVTFGLARAIFLCTLLKAEPLRQKYY